MSPNLVGPPPSPSLVEPQTEAQKLLDRLTPHAPSDLSPEDFFTRDTMDWCRGLVENSLPALEAEATAPLLAAVTDVLREWDRRQSPDPGGWHGRALVKAVNRLRALLPAEPPEAPE